MRRITNTKRRTVIITAVTLSVCVFFSACGNDKIQAESGENSIATYEHNPTWGGSTSDMEEAHDTITPTPEEADPSVTDQPQVTAAPTDAAQTEDTTGTDTSSDDVNYQEVSDQVMVAVNTLNLRYGPSTDYTVYRKSTYGEVFTRIGIGDNGWNKLLVEGITCYAYAAYMDLYEGSEESQGGETAEESGTNDEVADENTNEGDNTAVSDDSDTTDSSGNQEAEEIAQDTTDDEAGEEASTEETAAEDEQNEAGNTEGSSTADQESDETIDTPGYAVGSLASLSVVSMSDPLYNYNRMVDDLTTLAVSYPDWMKLNTLGSTKDGRTIYDVVIGNRDADQSILVVAGMEGCYYATTQLVMKQIEYYVTCHENAEYNGTSFKSLLDTTAIHVVPMLNPDGIFISQYGLDGITSADISSNVSSWYATSNSNNTTSLVFADYLKYWTANANGVDIDKNFAYGWEGCNSTATSMNTGYKGESAESESESKAIANFIRTQKPKAVLCYQGINNQIYWDYGQTQELRKLSNAVVTAVQTQTGYSIVNYEEGTLQGGSLADWTVLDQGLPMITITAGTYAAPYDSSILEGLWKANKDVWAAVLNLFK